PVAGPGAGRGCAVATGARRDRRPDDRSAGADRSGHVAGFALTAADRVAAIAVGAEPRRALVARRARRALAGALEPSATHAIVGRAAVRIECAGARARRPGTQIGAARGDRRRAARALP